MDLTMALSNWNQDVSEATKRQVVEVTLMVKLLDINITSQKPSSYGKGHSYAYDTKYHKQSKLK